MLLFIYFIVKEYSDVKLILIFSFLAGAIGAFWGYSYFYNKYLEDSDDKEKSETTDTGETTDTAEKTNLSE